MGEVVALPRKPGKPPARRVPSDDCTVVIAGEEYAPHAGEWVEVNPGFSVGGLRALKRMRSLGMELSASQGEPDAGTKIVDAMDAAFDELCGELATRVVAWNWTDDQGVALPQPDRTPARFYPLRTEEIYWLVAATQGESSAERKNG